jgi:hypothetical protein
MNRLKEGIDSAITKGYEVAANIAGLQENLSSHIRQNAGKLTLAATAFTGIGMQAAPAPAHAAVPAEAQATNTEATAESTEESDTEQTTTNEDNSPEAIYASILQNKKDAMQRLGLSEEVSQSVVSQELSVFFGGDRAEIVGERADGACIIKTQEGKYLNEFTKTNLEAGQTPEESKESLVNGLCDAEGGVNVPAVASYMALIEAIKNNLSVNENFDAVFSNEQTQKYVDAMQNHPDLAQAYYETVIEHLNNAEFEEAIDISGRSDKSVYADENGSIHTVNVTNKNGVSGVLVMFEMENVGGTVVKQAVFIKKCNQPSVTEQTPEPTPQPEAPAPAPAPEPETPPPAEPIPQTFSASYCAGLNSEGEEIIEQVTGFETQEEADRAAEELNQPCEPAPTTSTSTTAPTTSTTEADKDPTQTTVPIPSTTVPPTEPEAPIETRPDAPVHNNQATETTTVQNIAGAVSLGAIGNPEQRQAGFGIWGTAGLVAFVALSRTIKKRKLIKQ